MLDNVLYLPNKNQKSKIHGKNLNVRQSKRGRWQIAMHFDAGFHFSTSTVQPKSSDSGY